MEPHIVRFKSYDGCLPKPALFPVRETGRVYTVKDCPYSICDGYAIDMYSDQVKEDTVVRESPNIRNIMSGLESKDSLTAPMYVCDNFYGMQIFVLFNQINKAPIVLQTKYYQYFYYRYNGCQFRGSDSADPVGIFYHRVVGAIMPVVTSMDIEIPYYEGGTK